MPYGVKWGALAHDCCFHGDQNAHILAFGQPAMTPKRERLPSIEAFEL